MFKRRLVYDYGFFALRYLWFYTIGWKIVVLGLLWSGAVTCWVVTSNHQGEDKLPSKEGLKVKG